jgi:hypothetical protein
MKLLKLSPIAATDFLIPILAGIAVIFTACMSLTTTPLVDYSYAVENAYRIYAGQIPYKDFILVLTPGTYYVMAGVMHLVGGYTHISQLLLTMFITFLTIIGTAIIQRSIAKSFWGLRLILLLPFLVTGSTIFAFPLYDLFVIAAIIWICCYIIFCHQRTEENKYIDMGKWVILGLLLPIPILFKQNTGIIFFIAILSGYGFFTIKQRTQNAYLRLLYILVGSIATISSFVGLLILTGSASSFLYQTIIYPGHQRDVFDKVHFIIAQYQNVFIRHWSILFGLAAILLIGISYRFSKGKTVEKIFHMGEGMIIIGGCILSILLIPKKHNSAFFFTTISVASTITYLGSGAVFLYVLCKKMRQNSFLHSILFIGLFGAAHATYLSQGIVGSSYGIWPIITTLFLFIIVYIKTLSPNIHWQILPMPWIVFVIVILSQALIGYEYHGFYQRYGDPVHATSKRLQGLTLQGKWWVDELEELVAFTNTLPKKDIIAYLPGEDPFYAATDRVNPLPCVQFQPVTCPFSAQEYVSLMKQKNVTWVIIKTFWQAISGDGPGGLYNFEKNPAFLSLYEQVPADYSSYVIYKQRL